MRAESHAFLLSPQQWRTFNPAITLNWQRIRFNTANRASVPKEPGVYAFTVEYQGAGLPQHGFIMYFGITGRNLFIRFGEYLREKSRGRRLSVQMMLNEFEDDLFFHFVPLNLNVAQLKALETSLIDAIMPPINEGDYSAEMKRKRRAM